MQGVIELPRLSKEEVVIEKSRAFERSAFKLVYKNAINRLQDMILKRIRSEENRYEEDGNTAEEELSAIRIQGETNNIISFEGRRGTGKSSAMLSVHYALKDFNEKFYSGTGSDVIFTNSFLQTLEKEKTQLSFTAIQPIDASMLEKNENILEIVVANMFYEFMDDSRNCSEEEYEQYNRRELYRQFEKVYGNIIALRGKKDPMQRELSPLRILNRVSNSQVLDKDLGNLIETYLEYMDKKKGYYGKRKRFLVISIDDLDMNFQKSKQSPYETLETLHRYLFRPNVIILLTYYYPDLCLGCEKHFFHVYPNEVSRKEAGKHVHTLAVDYLKKMIPIYSRIHMPSMQKRDYLDGNELRIHITQKELDGSLSNIKPYLNVENRKDSVDLDVKKFALLLKASTVDLYYDAKGEKRHFSEPSTLRELTQMYRLYSMMQKKMEEKDGEKKVFKELLDDLYFRFASEKLNHKEKSQFDRYLQVRIKRRSQDIVQDIQKCKEKKSGTDTFSEITYTGKKEISYSYGELLFGLYRASESEWFSKELIWCILDSYTIVLTKLYRKLRELQKDENGKGTEDVKKKMLDIMGVSVASSWSNRYLPMVKRIRGSFPKDEDGLSLMGGSGNTAEKNDYRIKAEGVYEVKVGSVKVTNRIIQWDYEINMEKPDEEDLQMFEVLAMFFTNVFYRQEDSGIQKGFDIKFPERNRISEIIMERGFSDAVDNSWTFRISFTDGCFNIMNFVTNLFRGEEFFEQIHKNLYPAYAEYYKRLNNTDAIDCREIDNFFENHSLKKEWKKWKNDGSFGFAMPVYSFDMMYNILKRQYQQHKRIPHAVESNQLWDYVKLTYAEIGELLKKEEEFYFADVDSSMCQKRYAYFYQNYQNSPFIKYINQLPNNPERKAKFERTFGHIAAVFAQTQWEENV